MIEIVPMAQCHTAQIAALEKQCFSLPWSENSICGELSLDISLWLVALDGDTVAGYIGSQTCGEESDMMNLAVAPAYRKAGTGTLLVESLCAALRGRGATVLTLEVRASNTPAVLLYEKLGFTVIGRRPHYYEKPVEDAVIYRKEL